MVSMGRGAYISCELCVHLYSRLKRTLKNQFAAAPLSLSGVLETDQFGFVCWSEGCSNLLFRVWLIQFKYAPPCYLLVVVH